VPRRLKRKARSFDLYVQDMMLRVTAPEELYEEARVAAMSFSEKLQAYGIRDRQFRTSRRPVEVPEDAPAIVREIAEVSRVAGVGPMFALQGAITDHVGRFLALRVPEVLVSNGGDYFVVTRKRARLAVHPGSDPAGRPIALVVRPELGPHGIFTSMGQFDQPVADPADGLVVVASSCMLAEAAATGAQAMSRRPEGFTAALAYLQRLPGLFGAVVLQGEQIGLAGSLELAA